MRTITNEELRTYILDEMNKSEDNLKLCDQLLKLVRIVFPEDPKDEVYTKFRSELFQYLEKRRTLNQVLVPYFQEFYKWLTGERTNIPTNHTFKKVKETELTEKVRRTQKETIIECLRTLGPQEIKDISKNTGIKYHSVCQILSKNKGSVFTKRFDKWYVTEDLDRSDKVDPVSK